MKKLATVLSIPVLIILTLTACQEKEGGDCSIHGQAADDGHGHNLICGETQQGKWVWIRV